ncbi:hypothetical protein FISHEDRAFT_25740, partial [Fistulina hepatica ATCC 64428]
PAKHFYASRALSAVGLKTPLNFITTESVQQGKPAPDLYLFGAKLSGVDPGQCNYINVLSRIIVEDAPTSICSGKAAGCVVLATCTSLTRAALGKENPDFLVEDLSHMMASRTPDGGVSLFITQPPGRAYPKSAAPTPVDMSLPTPLMSRTVS